MYKINLNDLVRVKLTTSGKQLVRRNWMEWHTKLPNVFREFRAPIEDENGYSSWMLWELFEVFGEYLNVGQEYPFVGGDIVLGKGESLE